ncbi:MAG: hypothetical protein SO210_06190 [Bacteroidaceae bacterium]|nr:hypothetical protein [Bacteroidaceae bacterium]
MKSSIFNLHVHQRKRRILFVTLVVSALNGYLNSCKPAYNLTSRIFRKVACFVDGGLLLFVAFGRYDTCLSRAFNISLCLFDKRVIFILQLLKPLLIFRITNLFVYIVVP